MDKPESKDEAEGFEALDNRLSSIEKRIEAVSAKIDVLTYVRSVQNAFQNQRDKYTQFHQILNDFIGDRVALHDMMKRIKVLFRGHEDLLAGFDRFLSACYELKHPDDFVDAMNFINKVKDRFSDESTKYRTFLEIITSYRDKNATHAEVYSMAARLFQDQQDLLEDLRKFIPCLR